MQKDSGVTLKMLKVDGGMTANTLLMQFQADLLDVPVLTPQTFETTSLGAASAAGLAVGYWNDYEELREIWCVGNKWDPYMPRKTRQNLIKGWSKAIEKSLGWVDKEEEDQASISKQLSESRSVVADQGSSVSGDDEGYGSASTWFMVATALAMGFVVGTKFRWR